MRTLEVSTLQAPQNQAEPLLARLLLVLDCLNNRYMGRRVRARGAIANFCNQTLALRGEHRADGVELHGLLATSGGDDAALAELVPGVDGEELLPPAAG